MLIILRACGLAIFVFMITLQAKAAAPSDTESFIAYCTDANFESCRSEVMDVANINLMKQIGGTYSCTLPQSDDRLKRAADRITATKAILAWLKANPTKRLPKTYDAISQAMEALWPSECQK
ncbi:MAG TPA: hypothetical protein VGE85_15835 [Terracidiphilus sp.]|jgi:hypothetical protein